MDTQKFVRCFHLLILVARDWLVEFYISISHHLVFPPSFDKPLLSIGIPRRVRCLPGQVYSLSYSQPTTIGALPDHVLLDIFCLYREDNARHGLTSVWKWELLVHICQRWRQVVFASPLRLDLRILCTPRTPVGKVLGIWPALPIHVNFDYNNLPYGLRDPALRPSGEDNIVTALRHVDRVCGVRLRVTDSQLVKMTTLMQEPFPALTSITILTMCTNTPNPPVLPAEFLGGSAPHLQDIHLSGIPFPGLPTLLLSTSHLIDLKLHRIPPSGYISPEAMVVSLAALPRLRHLAIGFQSVTPRPYWIPPLTRTILPALTDFQFAGAIAYLEDLVSRIDTPQLDRICVFYLNQLVDFRVNQLAYFVNRTIAPNLTQLMYARVTIYFLQITFDVSRHANHDRNPYYSITPMTFSMARVDWQVSQLVQVLNQSYATLSNVVHLKVEARLIFRRQLEGSDDLEWLHLFQQFPTVRTLHVYDLYHMLVEHITVALEALALEAVPQTLPSLDLLYLAGQPASSMEKFVAARQLSGRPVTVVETEMEFNEKLRFYVSKKGNVTCQFRSF